MHLGIINLYVFTYTFDVMHLAFYDPLRIFFRLIKKLLCLIAKNILIFNKIAAGPLFSRG